MKIIKVSTDLGVGRMFQFWVAFRKFPEYGVGYLVQRFNVHRFNGCIKARKDMLLKRNEHQSQP
jgi:hypothetical protein